MAIAGFYAIQCSEIRFGRDGRWYADGEVIENEKIARLFSRSICRAEGGGYQLRVGEETAEILVDDTPYVVTAVEVGEEIAIVLSDETREVLAVETVEIGADGVSYCRVKDGSERARLLRPAHYQLAALIGEGEGGGFELRIGSRVYPIHSR